MRIFNSLIVPKNLKETLWNFLTFVLLQNIEKMKEGPFGDIKKIFENKSQKAEKGGGGGVSYCRKKENLLLRKTCKKKLAHRRGFEPGPYGLKSKHLTARPKKCELCDLRSEMRVVARKKNSHFPITLAYRKCSYS